jgi:long-subunit fatty acid transport protein
MRVARSRPVASTTIAIATLLIGSSAYASTGYEFPDNGTEQLGRAGAWVARASNPLATYFNPAGLAGQNSGVMLTTNLVWQKNCLKRTHPDGSPATAGSNGTYVYPEEVCNENAGTPFPNPQLAAVLKLDDRISLGFAVLGPSTKGRFKYPELVDGTWNGNARKVPGPQRYLLMEDDLIFVWPQLGIGIEVADDFRLGASVIWGLARFKFTAMAAGFADAQSSSPSGYPNDDFTGDFRADLDVKDLFIPGFTVGALWSPSSNIDIGAWYQWMDDIKAKGDTTIFGPVYGANPQNPPQEQGSTSTSGDSVSIVAPWPMQARLGFRYHQPREGNIPEFSTGTRDPMAFDVFDIEVDLTWANNSQFDELTVTLPENTYVRVGTIDFEMPTDASIPHKWKDAYGVRLGGDYVLVPNKFALRAGAFFETEAQDPKYLHVDYVPSQMFGLDVGATMRFGALDVMVGYGHVFFKGLDNGGDGMTKGLAGTTSATGEDYRTEAAVNGGSNSSVVNVASLGAGYTF